MKDTIKGSRTLGYLEKIYRALNEHYFENQLEMPLITVQSTPRAYGHVTCGKIWQRGNEEAYELNIGAGTLNRPIENVVSTMLHEMVHIYNLMNGIQDVSRGNTYHNKKFKEKAESVGLVIEHDPRYGWTITSPSESLFEYILDMGWTEINMNRNEGFTSPRGGVPASGSKGDEEAPTKKPSSTRKMICPKCGNSCRCTKDILLICGNCYDGENVIYMERA